MARKNVKLEIGNTVSLKSGDGYTPQCLCFVSKTERYVFCSSPTHSTSTKRHVLKCTASGFSDLGAKVATGHSNGGTYCPVDGCFYVTAYDGGESTNVVKRITKKWGSTKINFSHSVTGIAYDVQKGYFYCSGGAKIYVYNGADVIQGGSIGKSKIIKQFNKGFADERAHQDIGAYNGIVLSCKSIDGGGSHQTSYIDCYDVGTSKYIKSYKIDNNAELESVAVDSDGYMHLLFAQTRKICRSKTPFNLSSDVAVSEGGYGGAKAINDTALKLAWPSGTNSSTYAFKGGKPTDAFKKAFDDVYPKHNSWSNWQGQNGPAKGASCDVFAGTVLRASGYVKNAPRGLGSQLKEFPSSDKFKVTKYDGAPSSKSAVSPGDIVMYKRSNGNGHIMVICQEKGKTVIAEASVNNTYGHINTSLGKVTSKSNKQYTYVCRPTGMVGSDQYDLVGTKQYVEGFSYGGGIKQLATSSNYEYIYDWDRDALLKKLTDEKIEYTFNMLKDSDSYSEAFKSTKGVVPDEVVFEKSPKVENYKLRAKRPTIYKGQKEANNLLSAESLIQAPIIMIDFNGVKIGGIGNSGDDYPNYLKSVTVSRLNGKINKYTINLSYQVRPNEDANTIDKLISMCGYTNPIKIEYGDANSSSAMFREESALITNVRYLEDVSSSTIDYTIEALSSLVVASGSTRNYPLQNTKPSSAIYDLLYNSGESSMSLQTVFPGMRNRSLVSSNNLIPTNDKSITISPQRDMDAISYLSFLVSCMNNESNMKSSYYLTYYDDVHGVYGGPYFKITEVKNYGDSNTIDLSSTSDFFEVDIGYPTDNMVINFGISTNQYWGQVYEYNDRIPSYRYGIDDSGNIYKTQYNRLLSDNAYLTESLTTSNWWRDATEFPISAKLTVKGVLKTVMLMSYIRVNAQFYGQRDIASGIYVVTEQIDTVSENGFFTELTLLRVAGDNPGLN